MLEHSWVTRGPRETCGGTRGGQVEFKWSDVSADKDREVRPLRNYGPFAIASRVNHGMNRATWVTVSTHRQDVHWYFRDENETAAERKEELKKIKEVEAEALAAALCVLFLLRLFVCTCFFSSLRKIRSYGTWPPR
jgi:hypothetical protein